MPWGIFHFNTEEYYVYPIETLQRVGEVVGEAAHNCAYGSDLSLCPDFLLVQYIQADPMTQELHVVEDKK